MAFGRFERNAASQPMGEINITPLVDVMLVLVVIFILAAPLVASSIQLNLPRALGAASPTEAPPSVAVSMDASGKIFLDDKPVNAAQLADHFAQLARSRPETELRLRADTTVPYGRVVEVMDAARQAGLNRIGFVTDPLLAEGASKSLREPVLGPAPAPRTR